MVEIHAQSTVSVAFEAILLLRATIFLKEVQKRQAVSVAFEAILLLRVGWYTARPCGGSGHVSVAFEAILLLRADVADGSIWILEGFSRLRGDSFIEGRMAVLGGQDRAGFQSPSRRFFY